MNYWLMKSEPDVFSFDDLMRAPGRRTCWDGVRNYQARNLLRDAIKPGDGVLYYHSNAEPSGVAGIARVVRGGYPDLTAFDPKDLYYDPKSRPEAPTWYMVDIEAVEPLPRLLTLAEIKAAKGLENMVLLNNSRLSVQPVAAAEWRIVRRLAGLKP